jgi:hypothetical protein
LTANPGHDAPMNFPVGRTLPGGQLNQLVSFQTPQPVLVLLQANQIVHFIRKHDDPSKV